ncbi:MAG: hypothetical protein CVU59_08145 [Deltaproteobacteria bacterium HGW-Deltaproteobacteria-17]|nr:MAG: hypothetical protein CVU59_08145 [Deltaproteobacteria bacterium HGW-Deltaproteobacteria-17]
MQQADQQKPAAASDAPEKMNRCRRDLKRRGQKNPLAPPIHGKSTGETGIYVKPATVFNGFAFGSL